MASQGQASKSSITKRRFPYRFVLLLLAIGLIALAAQIFRNISGPAIGKIKTGTVSEAKEVETEQYIRQEGQHGSFTYPGGYRIEAGKGLPPSIFESFSLISPARPRQPYWTIAVTVYKLPVINPNQNSSYKIREDNPKTYEKTLTKINGRQYTVFKKTDAPEKVAFIQSGLKLTAIAVSGAIASSQMDSDYNYVLGSWEWK